MEKLRFRVVIKNGERQIANICGTDGPLTTGTMTVEDAQRIPETEQFLERLTGLRFHIEQVHKS